jgi:hypothetical protein
MADYLAIAEPVQSDHMTMAQGVGSVYRQGAC